MTFVCRQDYTKTTQLNFMKPGGEVDSDQRNTSINFVVNLVYFS